MCVYDYTILYHIISYPIILYYIILLYYIFTCIHIVQMLSNLHPKDWQMSSYRNRFPQISMTDHLFPHSNGLNLSYYVFFVFRRRPPIKNAITRLAAGLLSRWLCGCLSPRCGNTSISNLWDAPFQCGGVEILTRLRADDGTFPQVPPHSDPSSQF